MSETRSLTKRFLVNIKQKNGNLFNAMAPTITFLRCRLPAWCVSRFSYEPQWALHNWQRNWFDPFHCTKVGILSVGCSTLKPLLGGRVGTGISRSKLRIMCWSTATRFVFGVQIGSCKLPVPATSPLFLYIFDVILSRVNLIKQQKNYTILLVQQIFAKKHPIRRWRTSHRRWRNVTWCFNLNLTKFSNMYQVLPGAAAPAAENPQKHVRP